MLLEDREAELAQLAFQVTLVAAGVPVAQGMELRGVVHVGEVGKLMADDVADERLGHEHEVARQLDDPFGRAMTQLAHAAPHFKARWGHTQLLGHLAG